MYHPEDLSSIYTKNLFVGSPDCNVKRTEDSYQNVPCLLQFYR